MCRGLLAIALAACSSGAHRPDAGNATADASADDSSPADGASNACAGPGTIDTSFGTGGVVTFFGVDDGKASVADAVKVDASGRILIAGGFTSGARSCIVARLLPDGSPDASFGANGVVRQSIGNTACWYNDVIPQADGRVIAFGEIDGHDTPQAVIARYEANGSLDTSFGDGGIVIFEPSPITSGLAATLDAQERIIVVGDTDQDDVHTFYARRYLQDGSPDTSFGNGGIAEQAFGSGWDGANGVFAQADGKLVVVGGVATSPAENARVGVARYRDDGLKDPDFGAGGEVPIAFGTSAEATGVLTDSQGRVVVAGASPSGAVLLRLQPQGSLDPGFGSAGAVVDSDQIGLAYRDIEPGPDGTLLVFGQAAPAYTAVLARYTESGERDPTFGSNGFAEALPLSMYRQRGEDAAVQADGHILVAGGYGDIDGFDMYVARYCP